MLKALAKRDQEPDGLDTEEGELADSDPTAGSAGEQASCENIPPSDVDAQVGNSVELPESVSLDPVN